MDTLELTSKNTVSGHVLFTSHFFSYLTKLSSLYLKTQRRQLICSFWLDDSISGDLNYITFIPVIGAELFKIVIDYRGRLGKGFVVEDASEVNLGQKLLFK